ncbi:hypothetical protein [Clostridium cellulovorans]|uniref:Lipoprotein n=1 Tax=Clostridium cellulovorans (strain ATCC 35296 / DSM 3052 / OCM 3 / 743B) TaxID=573061 RepID=D9ST25_CLOC7|nr:hypothetical protein [Clostridium cellulovorans]ADL52687.1 hypothetical protein Clocel_2995 [Clostridium cellulovorans 743B]
MRLNQGRSITFITVIALIILLSIGGCGFISNYTCYKKISDDSKIKVNYIVKERIGETPNLQTDSCKAEWTQEAHAKQTELMDKVLNGLTIIGESRKGKPSRYITASFYDNMNIYIPYNKKNPHNNIIVEIDSVFYIATANKEDVRAVLGYMKNKYMLR